MNSIASCRCKASNAQALGARLQEQRLRCPKRVQQAAPLQIHNLKESNKRYQAHNAGDAQGSQVFCGSLFGVGKQGEEAVDVAFDAEIKAPPPVDPGLPDIASRIVFFGLKGRVAEILNQKGDAAVNRPLDS